MGSNCSNCRSLNEGVPRMNRSRLIRSKHGLKCHGAATGNLVSAVNYYNARLKLPSNMRLTTVFDCILLLNQSSKDADKLPEETVQDR